tara:strand:+ start:857 stop:1075 length:219 start_codon:yes stop_codon:yes gene_type:complete
MRHSLPIESFLILSTTQAAPKSLEPYEEEVPLPIVEEERNYANSIRNKLKECVNPMYSIGLKIMTGRWEYFA